MESHQNKDEKELLPPRNSKLRGRGYYLRQAASKETLLYGRMELTVS